MTRTRVRTETLRVPLLADGSLVGWPSPAWEDTPDNRRAESGESTNPYFNQYAWRWHDAFEWDDVMTLEGAGRGRSAVVFTLRGEGGATYPMFLSRFVDLVRGGCLPGPTFRGRWGFCKQGQNYSLRLAEPAPADPPPPEARALALAVLAGDRVAAAALADLVTEGYR